MTDRERDADPTTRLAEIRRDLKAVWESRSFPPGSGGTLGRLLEAVAWLLEERERQAQEARRAVLEELRQKAVEMRGTGLSETQKDALWAAFWLMVGESLRPAGESQDEE